MNIEAVKKYYSDIITSEESAVSKLKKTIFQIGTLRLVVSIVCFVGVYALWGNTNAVVGTIGISLVIFLALMQYHSKLYKERKYREQKMKNAKNELDGLDYNFSAFDGAPEKINAEHSFSLDLDLFGNRSFFQSINRTVTSFGKNTLANNLIEPLKDKDLIIAKQHGIEELKNKLELLTHFRATGQMIEVDNLDTKNFAKVFSYPPLLCNSKLWNILVVIVPSIYILLGILVFMDVLSGNLFLPLYIITFIISAISNKKSSTIASTFDDKAQILDIYSQLFSIIENEKFESPLLKNLQQQLESKTPASEAIKNLKSRHGNLLMSNEYPILLLINPLFLWNAKYGIKVEKWIQEYKDEVQKWFQIIAEFDALISWGIFAFNHPDYTYPKPESHFVFSGTDLGHPLLDRSKCVRNNINISKTPYFLVVTGANMAGKSTYLRTIGINHTLACAGAPVCADSLTFYPGNLVTNLRTADSLADNESYFFAELKRLKMIIDRLQSGEELFIILDEILKGTNSVDKQNGSLALIKQFISLNGNGIIATHDLLLGTLENEYPNNIKNYRFEADITNDNLSFTYKIREGVAENMNATFLMKKMGITGL